LHAFLLPYGDMYIVLAGGQNQFWRSYWPRWICVK